MASLSDHLRASSSHGQLPFHGACPICREERLRGVLGAEALFTPRGCSGVLVATVAASTLALPSVALADRVTGGAIGHVAQVSDGELDGINAYDGTQADTPAAEDDAPLDGRDLITPDSLDGQEEPPPSPVSELSQEQAGEGDEPVESEGGPESAVTPNPAPVRPVPPPPTPAAPPAAAPASDAQLKDPGTPDDSRPNAGHLRLVFQDGQGEPAGQPVPSPAGPASRQPTPAVSTSVRSTPPMLRDKSQRHGLSRGRRYTVREGDTLWSIAQRLLGRDVSVARVADEVNRLWDLNRNRIATGDPNLLPVGTELRL